MLRRTCWILLWVAGSLGCNGADGELDPTNTEPICIPRKILTTAVAQDAPGLQPAGVIGLEGGCLDGAGDPLYPGAVTLVFGGDQVVVSTHPTGSFAASVQIDPQSSFGTVTPIDLERRIVGAPVEIELLSLDPSLPPLPVYDPVTDTGVFIQLEESPHARVEGRNAAQPEAEILVANADTGQVVTTTADGDGSFVVIIDAEEGDEIVVIQNDGDGGGPPISIIAPPRQCPDPSERVFYGQCRRASPGQPVVIEVPGTRPELAQADTANGAVFVSPIYRMTADEGYGFVSPHPFDVEFDRANLPLEELHGLLRVWFSPPTEGLGIWYERPGIQTSLMAGGARTEGDQVGFYRVGIDADALCAERFDSSLDRLCFERSDEKACGWLRIVLEVCGLADCGDGFVNVEGEECDDHNGLAGDGCDDSCMLEGCGDGAVQPELGEVCDDGNEASSDACVNCRNAVCGDGFIWSGHEVCDDGPLGGGLGLCNADCSGIIDPLCGNKIVEPGEACDDGDVTPGDGCNANCEIEICGNSALDQGEACDDGPQCGQPLGCQCDCSGFVGAACGNGLVETGEECDDGNADPNDECDNHCIRVECGNGILQSGEACDDGNGSNGDACLNDCLFNLCGDGFVYEGVESCDDGPHCGLRGGCRCDCSEFMPVSYCGDGVQEIGEMCDGGSSCGLPGECDCNCLSWVPGGAVCGNGIVETSETCDDGNANECLGLCNANCDGAPDPVACAPLLTAAPTARKGTSPGYAADHNIGLTGGPGGSEDIFTILPNDPAASAHGTDMVTFDIAIMGGVLAAGDSVLCSVGGIPADTNCVAGDSACLGWGEHPQIVGGGLDTVNQQALALGEPGIGTSIAPDEMDTCTPMDIVCAVNGGAQTQQIINVCMGFIGTVDQAVPSGTVNVTVSPIVYCSNGATEYCTATSNGAPLGVERGVNQTWTDILYDPAVFDLGLNGEVIQSYGRSPSEPYLQPGPGDPMVPSGNVVIISSSPQCVQIAPGVIRYLSGAILANGSIMVVAGGCTLSASSPPPSGTITAVDVTSTNFDFSAFLTNGTGNAIRGVDNVTFQPLPSTNVTGYVIWD